MNMELIRKIEKNIAELEERAKKNGELIVTANSNIESLNTQKASITDETNRIMGAIQAFRFVLAEPEAKPDADCSAVTEVKAEENVEAS